MKAYNDKIEIYSLVFYLIIAVVVIYINTLVW